MQININESNKILELLDKSKDILIATHVDPDGDAIGSSLAMYNTLIKLGYNVDCIIKSPSKSFAFLKGFDKAKSDENDLRKSYETIIVLDCGDNKRVGLERDFNSFNNIIVIDHHITHEEFGTITLVDSKSPATAQIIYDIITSWNIDIDLSIAECIYTGILTDTGGFKYSNVQPHTFEIAKELLDIGINSSDITRRVFEIMSYGKFNLLKLALNNIEIIDKNIAYLYLSSEDIEKYQTDEPDIHEGLVNYGRDIEGIEVSIFIRGLGDNKYKLSLRSNNYVDVSKIALEFSGGGHTKAAGASLEGNIKELKDIIINKVKEIM